MALFGTIAGFSLFGLALTAGFGQLVVIKKRKLLQNLGGHTLSMGVFGYAGYTSGTNVRRLCLRRSV
ncbi:hypothetical protein BDR03DRAFT_870057 [Suillus americanus]|nr:hypothetical protein BDR03DRAFT_870057 [Suillus americanus]